MYRIETSQAAKRDLRSVPVGERPRIDGAISSLANDPRPQGARKLRGSGTLHRIRVGRWRVIYHVFDRDQVVLVVKVARRSEDTYDNI